MIVFSGVFILCGLLLITPSTASGDVSEFCLDLGRSTDPLTLGRTRTFFGLETSFRFSLALVFILSFSSLIDGLDGRRRFRNASGFLGIGLAVAGVGRASGRVRASTVVLLYQELQGPSMTSWRSQARVRGWKTKPSLQLLW